MKIFRIWSIVWIKKKKVFNNQVYKIKKALLKKTSDDPKYQKGTINYYLNKYLLFATQKESIFLLDPIGTILANN